MGKICAFVLSFCLLVSFAAAAQSESVIQVSDNEILVNGQPISADQAEGVYLAMVTETHEDVPEELSDVQNRVVTIAEAGVYRISGKASDIQIAVKAGDEDKVRLILDGVDLSCRTAPVIAGYNAYDSRIPGEYGLIIELAEGSENFVVGSHTSAASDDELEFDGAIGTAVSLGFEGSGSLHVDADKEGIETSSGHMTFNGGVFHISACDDPVNVSEDGFGVLTINDGYLFSSVKPEKGGEGDGMDSNGSIVINGGVTISLAHPTSRDGGIDSDLGSSINGGILVGAGNMYSPLDFSSQQLFMSLEFAESTSDLVVVTDEMGTAVFAYDFPYDYKYIVFSAPDLTEGSYRIYLGGEIEGKETDGLYTEITSYIPGELVRHGGSVGVPQGAGGMPGNMEGRRFSGNAPGPNNGNGRYMGKMERLDLNKILKDVDLNTLLKGKDLNNLHTGFSLTDILTEEQIQGYARNNPPPSGQFGGMGGGRGGMRYAAGEATCEFVLSKDSSEFINVERVQ